MGKNEEEGVLVQYIKLPQARPVHCVSASCVCSHTETSTYVDRIGIPLLRGHVCTCSMEHFLEECLALFFKKSREVKNEGFGAECPMPSYNSC